MATAEPHGIKRLTPHSEPEALADTLKTHKARWPRLFGKADTSAAPPGTGEAPPATSATDPGTRAATQGAGGRGSQAEHVTPETRAATVLTSSQERRTDKPRLHTGQANAQTGQEDSGTRMQKPLSDRLVTLFGKGDNPTLRMTLYMRIQFTCQNFGREAELVLRDVIDAAKTKRNPGNYFAYSIVRRFRESGFFRED